jgi:hypothetical protein
MVFFGLPASFYLVTSYWRERNARNVIVTGDTPSASLVPPEAKSDNTKLRLVSSA